jgi:hypothetical protein
MKRMLLFIMLSACLLTACEFHHIKGSGNLSTEDHHIGRAERIHIDGSFDVELTQGPTPSLKIEADDNLQEYITVEEHDGRLRIGFRDGANISTSGTITLYITVPRLEEFHLSGSGKVIGKSKFTEGDHLNLALSGSGEIDLDVNTPDLEADISGSGNITLRGETKDQDVKMSGSGSYLASDLKSEHAKISIAGSGNSRVFADGTLDVSIAGSGSVYYKGSATISKSIVGSGGLNKIND